MSNDKKSTVEFVDDEKVVLQAVICHPFNGRHNKVVDRVRVVQAPPHVLRFVTDGDEIGGYEYKEVLADLVVKGYKVQLLKPEYEGVSIIEFQALYDRMHNF